MKTKLLFILLVAIVVTSCSGYNNDLRVKAVQQYQQNSVVYEFDCYFTKDSLFIASFAVVANSELNAINLKDKVLNKTYGVSDLSKTWYRYRQIDIECYQDLQSLIHLE